MATLPISEPLYVFLDDSVSKTYKTQGHIILHVISKPFFIAQNYQATFADNGALVG